MKTEDILIALRSVEERYKDTFVGTGNLNIGEMASDCAEVIEKLQTENTKLWAKLEQLKTEGRISPVKCPCDASEEAQELMNAKAEGRLLVLPCKVGDTVYVAVKDCHCEYEGDMNDCSCCDYVIMPCDDIFRYDEDEWQCGFKPHIREDVFCVSMYEAIGKTIFLTREEAEAALSKAGDPE